MAASQDGSHLPLSEKTLPSWGKDDRIVFAYFYLRDDATLRHDLLELGRTGVDVALTRMRALGGSIELHSELGKGSTFVLRLPVTLAIVRALIAGVGRERYALPLTYVSETVELGTAATTTVEGREAIVLRDRVVPLVHLRELLGVAGEIPPARRPIIVVEMGGRRVGVVVDGMLGQQEIVVKSFDAPQGTLPVFSGATIMGDGIPALILDAGGLL